MSSNGTELTVPDEGEATQKTSSKDPARERVRQKATVYDAVAGRVGPNGFLTTAQMANQNIRPLTPEEVLLGRVDVHETATGRAYNTARNLDPEHALPDADLLKDMHAYASHFYGSSSENGGEYDFKSMDETALLGMAILLEESMREALGETGDLAMAEPEGLEQGLPPSRMLQHQVLGKLVPKPVREYRSPSPIEVQEPTTGGSRKHRRRYLAAEM